MLDPAQGLVVYTDGSCAATDRIGGWGWYAEDTSGGTDLDGGPEWDTTISRMELTAAAKALETLHTECGPCIVLVISDSEYVVKGINDPSRKRNNNVDLWLWLEEVKACHELVAFEHTRGHAGTHGNEMADQIAGEMRLSAKALAEAVDPYEP